MALDLAIRYPDLVRALVLLEPDASRELAPAAVAWVEPVIRRLRRVATHLGVDAVAEALITEVAGGALGSFRTRSGARSAATAPRSSPSSRASGGSADTAAIRDRATDSARDGRGLAPEFHQAPEALAETIPNARLSQVGGGHLIDPAAPT